MAKISAADVKKLREATGAGMMDCKKALVEAEGNFDQAIDILRKKGQKIAAKRADRESTEGVAVTRINDAKTQGVAIVLACETDFVGKNEKFVALAKDVAMQVASMGATTLSYKDLSDEVLAKAEEAAKAQLAAEGKPEKIWDRILPGKMERFIADNTTLDMEQCLLDQTFIKDEKKNVAQYVKTYGDVEVSSFKRVTLG
ncbi:UNVERIFIED_CONTAM: hypothetical protein GTU68_043860 [Idotea baltica]|nr:hypothetical protein [Idotea baltica]